MIPIKACHPALFSKNKAPGKSYSMPNFADHYYRSVGRVFELCACSTRDYIKVDIHYRILNGSQHEILSQPEYEWYLAGTEYMTELRIKVAPTDDFQWRIAFAHSHTLCEQIRKALIQMMPSVFPSDAQEVIKILNDLKTYLEISTL